MYIIYSIDDSVENGGGGEGEREEYFMKRLGML